MIRTRHMHQAKGLGVASLALFGFALVALMAIMFSEGILPIESSAAHLGGEGLAWSMLR